MTKWNGTDLYSKNQERVLCTIAVAATSHQLANPVTSSELKYVTERFTGIQAWVQRNTSYNNA